MSKYVITGGAGFIGSNLADHYLRLGNRVAIFDNFSRFGAKANVMWLKQRHGDLLTVCTGDVREKQSGLVSIVERADVVFHLAAQVAVTTSIADPRLDLEVNIVGTFNVLEAVRQAGGGPALIYSSTNKVYGRMSDLDTRELEMRYVYAGGRRGIDETRSLDFHSPYGCSKGAGEQYVLDYARTYGLKTVVFRQSCIYGPRQFGVEDQGWIAWFAIRALQGYPVTVYGDGKQVRDALFIDDLVAAFDAAARRLTKTSGEVYNIGGGPENTLSLLELLSILEQELAMRPFYTFDKWRTGDQLVFVTDIRKAHRDLGWQPKVGVSEGVSRLVAWLRTNRSLFAGVQQAAMA